jgi:DNA (cytosine-5)-methyltransferase 1
MSRFTIEEMKPRVLDLFAGEGGAGQGYANAGYEVFGVELDAARAKRYPLEHVIGDALSFAYQYGPEFDLIHASPPCTGYSRGTAALPDRLDRYARLIAVTREVLEGTGVPFIIENVEDAKRELVNPLTVCWTEFRLPGSVRDEDGTPLWMRRHRLFESNLTLWGAGGCVHPTGMQCAGAYGGARRDKVEARTIRKGGYVPSLRVMRELLGTPWMSEKGCQLSIPPAYTEFLGTQIKDQL